MLHLNIWYVNIIYNKNNIINNIIKYKPLAISFTYVKI